MRVCQASDGGWRQARAWRTQAARGTRLLRQALLAASAHPLAAHATQHNSDATDEGNTGGRRKKETGRAGTTVANDTPNDEESSSRLIDRSAAAAV